MNRLAFIHFPSKIHEEKHCRFDFTEKNLFLQQKFKFFLFFLTHGYQKMNNNVWYFEYK